MRTPDESQGQPIIWECQALIGENLLYRVDPEELTKLTMQLIVFSVGLSKPLSVQEVLARYCECEVTAVVALGSMGPSERM
ncbi:hypothetical protein [Streptosporangium lutulentum]|uniref:Uncharacterized protein n=1 Tax=Streptosporangium lutulentum TaxID=1461250 RepID=A0ABT9QB10_9ACTN|nr:hypothetical protein [Streptosporangium lutulentum]MDP9843945.1 hypothetical protein [Streptosporangium lutulentum]